MAEGDTILRAARRIEAALGRADRGQRAEPARPRRRRRAPRRPSPRRGRDPRQAPPVRLRRPRPAQPPGDERRLARLPARGGGAGRARRPGLSWRASGRRRSSSAGRPCECCRRRGRGAIPSSRGSAPTSSPRTSTPPRDGRDPRRRPGRGVGDALLDQPCSPGSGTSSRARPASPPASTPGGRSASLPDELERCSAPPGRRCSDAVAAWPAPPLRDLPSPRALSRCGGPVRSRGQGDANRTTYWCPGCQV